MIAVYDQSRQIAVGDKVRIRNDASSMLAGREGTVVDIKHGGTNRYVSREPHYKVAFDPEDPEHVTGLWFDADEIADAVAVEGKQGPHGS